MENEMFINTGLPPPPSPEMVMHFEHPSSSSAMLHWSSMSSPMEIQPLDPNFGRKPTQDCFFWEKSTEQNIFDSALSSLVSSPTASNSNFSGSGGGESFVIRELIGKLGSIGNSSSEMYGNPGSNGNGSGSCYATPMSSPPAPEGPPKLSSPMMLGKPTPLAEFSGDPGFAERAARFSCFGSRSFNGRNTSPFAMNNCGGNTFINGPNTTVGTNGKMQRVSSSPALNALASHMCKKTGNEDSSPKVSGELSRKRKSVPKGKPKESSASPSPHSLKAGEGSHDFSDPKRSRVTEENGKKEEKRVKTTAEEEGKENNSTKPPEPPKDYIHVRARRGQATDSHSLAERVRREKIGERMKMLQDLVPGCNKVTGKALMLDEIINYVQSLQRQVEFLSMKLASVNTSLDFNVDALVSKEMISQQVLQLDSTIEALLGHQQQQNNLQLHPNISSNSTMIHQCQIDTSDTSDLTRNFTSHMPTPHQFTNSIPQYQTFSENDLHSIVQMGFVKNSMCDSEPIRPHTFQGSNQEPDMKIEL